MASSVAPLRAAIERHITSDDEVTGYTVKAIDDAWRVFSTGWRGGRNEVVVVRHSDTALTACGRMVLDKLSSGVARGYCRGTPATDPVSLLRNIETAPEGVGAGRLLLRLLGSLADADERWVILEAAPRGDLERALDVFAAAGFAKARPDSDDCIFIRPPNQVGSMP